MKRRLAKHESEVPRMKRIGIVGGMGQWATLDVIERMLRVSVGLIPQYGNRGYPPIDLRMLNKASMLLNEDGSFPKELKASAAIQAAAKFVGKEADFLIMPCNTAHLFSKEVEKAAGKPLLSIVRVTVNEVKRRKCKRVGLLAIGLTLEKRLYQKPLEEIGVESVIIPKNLSGRLDEEEIWALQEGAEVKKLGKLTRKAVKYLRKQKVDGIILGCTELPILLGKKAEKRDIINPSQLLAEAAVKKALGLI